MCGGSFCSNEMADDIELFFEKNPLPQSSRRISQMLESIRANAKFLGLLKNSGLAKDEFWTSL
jgi:puromycin-sensitive aminopeptidase